MDADNLNSNLNLLLVSNTKIPGGKIFFEYCQDEIINFVQGRKLLFIPYARPDMMSEEAYTEKAKESFKAMGLELEGIIDYNDPVKAIVRADLIYVGGGNTFLLTSKLYENQLIMPIVKQVAIYGIPYLGSSAGSNVAGPDMRTTNDMPIIQPESFNTLGLVPFNINPHYLDPLPIKHAGETREARLKEFIALNKKPVVGLREGTMLRVASGEIILKGNADYLEGKPGARVYLPSSVPTQPEIRECNLGETLNFVLPYCNQD